MERIVPGFRCLLDYLEENRLVVDVDTWTTIATVIWRMHKVPPSEHLEPDISYDDEAAPALWRRFIVEILIPKYWDSSEAAYAALEAESQRWAGVYRELDGKAEERAVAAALAKDGPIDSVSILRARVQREGDRDRATYAKLQERMLADDEAGEDAAETELT